MPKTTPQFETAYQKLNTAQKQAVDTTEGPVMVIAGPGTGKTQVLTLRIAKILLQSDTEPENILALTFTESGAYAMRKRLAELIGSPAYRVRIATFHGFCNEQIANYPDKFPRIIGSIPATDVDKVRIMEEIVAEEDLPDLRPYGDPLYYVQKIISSIRTLKSEGVSPQDFSLLLDKEEHALSVAPDRYHEKGAHKGKLKSYYKEADEHLRKSRQLAVAYSAYQKQLATAKKFDFEDMILETVDRLTHDEDFLLSLQEQYQYILADEHQDTNDAQNRILELLSGFYERPNLFIVGDEKQAIFRFQGASLANFLFFQKRFSDVVLITLTENYRSTQTVLDAAHSVIEKSSGDASLRKRLIAKNHGVGDSLVVAEFPTPHAELRFVADDIKRLIKEGTPPEEISVFYRNNSDVDPLIRALGKQEVPFVVLSDRNLYEDEDMRKLIVLLRAIDSIGDDTIVAPLLYLDFWELDPIAIHRVIHNASLERKRITDAIHDRDFLQRHVPTSADTLLTVAHLLSSFATLSRNVGILELVDTVINESGYLNFLIKKPGSVDRLEMLDAFLNELSRNASTESGYLLEDFVKYLDVLAVHKMKPKTARPGDRGGVRLMTVHKSKGLEFDYVYIIGVTDGHFGGKSSRRFFKTNIIATPLDRETDDDDERRLFYVAITRARILATISYASEASDGRAQLPSRFIEEIDTAYRTQKDISLVLLQQAERVLERFVPMSQMGVNIGDHKYLQERFLVQGLSVTALNNFLRCPWEYFFSNLVRIPHSQTKFQMYGTAVHTALNQFFDLWKIGETPPVEDLLARANRALLKQPLSVREELELQQKADKSLRGYYQTYVSTWARDITNELPIRDVHFSVKSEGEEYLIPLTGKLDKVEFLDGGRVNVVDYKTSQPKSRNEMEGKTKNSDGAYVRQLAFYQLLLSRHAEGKYAMEYGEIDFLEPNDKGTYIKEQFTVSSSDVLELEESISRVAQEILTLSFWDTTCAQKNCEYCSLRASIQPQILS